MTTAFISGITGMVGSHLADYILEKTNWEIVGLIRWRSPLDNISHLIDLINNKQRIKLIYGDLRDTISINKAIEETKPDYLFHLAAQSFPRTSFDSPLEFRGFNKAADIDSGPTAARTAVAAADRSTQQNAQGLQNAATGMKMGFDAFKFLTGKSTLKGLLPKKP